MHSISISEEQEVFIQDIAFKEVVQNNDWCMDMSILLNMKVNMSSLSYTQPSSALLSTNSSLKNSLLSAELVWGRTHFPTMVTCWDRPSFSLHYIPTSPLPVSGRCMTSWAGPPTLRQMNPFIIPMAKAQRPGSQVSPPTCLPSSLGFHPFPSFSLV